MTNRAARAEVVVDLDAIAANTAVLRERVARPLMAVVKADGYGHGLVPAARAVLAGGADALGVTVLDEALALRAAGVDRPGALLAAQPGHRLRPRARAGRAGLGERRLGAGRGGRRRAGRPAAPPSCTCSSTPGSRARAPRWRTGRRSSRPPHARRPTGTSTSSGCGATWPTPTPPRTRRSARRCGSSTRRSRSRGPPASPTPGCTWPTRRPRSRCRRPGTTWSVRASPCTGWTRSAAPTPARTACGRR